MKVAVNATCNKSSNKYGVYNGICIIDIPCQEIVMINLIQIKRFDE